VTITRRPVFVSVKDDEDVVLVALTFVVVMSV
jgi:hypothetical protein